MSLDEATRRLVGVAAALNDALEGDLARLMDEARKAGASVAWLEELVLEAPLFVGFPKALVAAAALRTLEPRTGDPGDSAGYERWRDWEERGVATCRRIYGESYAKLRTNLARLHPALDAWVVVEGYGRAISRPGLDLKRRELCAIAMLVAQRVPRQLHSHLRGALNVGASPAEVGEVLDIVARVVPKARAKDARMLWDQVHDVH
jgi:4-carboxymuconolactone decarboxylase